MYQNFYHLKKEPFHITPDPDFLFLSPSHKQALGSIIYGVKNRKGFVVITGEVGVGKTTILRSYLIKVDKPKVRIIYIFNANLSFKSLLNTIYKELGIRPKTDDTVEMLNDLYLILMEEYRLGNTVLLIIDEAQNMPMKTLENLRMLSNLETSKDKLLQIVLIGQYELEKTLDRYELRQLRQRIAIRSTIIPFTKEESLAYIKHRLAKVAVNQSKVFTRGALKRIVKGAKGIPRNLNILCDNALITGFGYKIRPVNSKVVKEVIADFNGKEKPSLLKWIIPLIALLIFMVGLFLIYPHKGLILSKVENRDLSRTKELKPIKEEMKPPIDKPDISQTEQRIPVKEEIKSTEEKVIPGPTKISSSVTRTVKKGDSLYKLTRIVYGYADDQLVAWVKQNNPWIKDINNLSVGEEIIFPEVVEDQVKAKAKAKE
jgi:general secretion pathway protein A